MERAAERYGPGEPLGRWRVDRRPRLYDLVDVHAIAVDPHDVAARIEQQARGQTQILPVHEQMPVEDRVARG